MSAQPLSHKRFAQAPPLKCLLELSLFDQFKPGRRPPTGRTPKPSSEPQLADGDRARDHGQGGSLDRLGSAARLTGDAQQQTMPPGGLHRDKSERCRRPKRLVHPKTRALAQRTKSDLPPGRRCPCRTPAPPDARTGIGTDTTIRQPASNAADRKSETGPLTPHGRRSGCRSVPPDVARPRGQCHLAATAARPALSRLAPIQPTDLRPLYGPTSLKTREMFSFCSLSC
jgi:hypothetical protein